MIIATYKNETANTQTEIHQIAAATFEVKRYWTKINGVDLVLRNVWVYDNLEKAQEMFNAIK